MKRTLTFLLTVTLSVLTVTAQKPPLDHSVYDGWQTVGSTIVSYDGKWISYQINPQQGDGILCLYNTSTFKLDSVKCGTKLSFSPLGTFAAYQISPTYDETRAAKKKKLKEDKMPKSNLEIRILANGEKMTILRVKSFGVPEKKSEWMAYLLEKRTEEKKDTASKSVTNGNIKASSKTAKKPEPKGTELVILNPVTKKEFRFNDVTEYNVGKDGKAITFLQDIPDTSKIDKFIVQYFDTQKETVSTLFEGKGTVKKLTANDQGSLVTFLFTTDTAKVKVYDLWCSKNNGNASKIIDSSNPALPAKWSVSENGNITFSDDGTRIYFGTARKPVKEPVDTLLEDEKYRMDLWSWDDDLLQPMQKKQLDQELKRTYLAVYHTDRNIMYQMSDSAVPDLRVPRKGNRDLALASSDLKYRKLSSWDDKNYTDYYLVNFETGSRKLLFENTPYNISLSPSENFLLIYDYDKKGWYSQPVQGGEIKCISTGIEFPLYDELNDSPTEPRPYGLAGWSDDAKHVFIYDRFDIWSLDLTGTGKPLNITNGFGRKNNLTLRYVRLDPDADFISRKEVLYLSAFNYLTKEAGFFTLKQAKQAEPVKLTLEKSVYARDIAKPKDVDILYFTKESFSAAPDLYISDMQMQNVKKISSINPQQKKYNWLTAELVEWYSFDNSKLQGILYKPENFDPSKKYPMIVYFYERSSDGLYSYFPPSPSASIINRSFAASNGYLVFVPDIPYIIGYPGQSCYNAVISGTNSLLDRFSFIDRNRLALDGQSWGGYQIAWLVTQTDLFKCAYAGAAVVNMVSAYGGIRWETGMSRMFQYEHTQSRIGGTLWEKPIQFIENSPIFFLPKVNTPLLIMHNDADGAVPWYQGIEFITALRRLNKPAWMLSYNDEAHNLVRRANRKDISIRKMQFFDHYLKDAPMPYWMKYGIDQTQKGKVNGYELVNE